MKLSHALLAFPIAIGMLASAGCAPTLDGAGSGGAGVGEAGVGEAGVGEDCEATVECREDLVCLPSSVCGRDGAGPDEECEVAEDCHEFLTCLPSGVCGDDGSGAGKTEEEVEREEELCAGEVQLASACEVSADCEAPMVCLPSGVCVGPNDPAYACDPIEDNNCQVPGESCINGLCVQFQATCETLDDCPDAHVCEVGQCKPQLDDSACADPAPGPALWGVYKTESVLHLREGLPSAVDAILDLAEDAHDLVNGEVALGLGVFDFVVGAIVADLIKEYVPEYGIEIVEAVATLSDVLDTMTVSGTMTLQGQACDGNYRGSHDWTRVTFDLNGTEMSVLPEDLPGIDEVIPEEFDARYHCGDLLISKHRISNTMGGLIRWLVDTTSLAITGYSKIELAIGALVNCGSVSVAVADYVNANCPSNVDCSNAEDISKSACEALLAVGVSDISQALDDASVSMSLIKLNGVLPVDSDGTLGAGQWFGSLVGGDFPGTLSATKQ